MARKKEEEKSAPEGKIDEIMKKIRTANPEVMIGWGSDIDTELKYIPTGIAAIDSFIGGGWPRARFSVIGGPKGSGKSTLVLTTIANAQKNGLVCVYADLENTFDPKWAANLGVDTDHLIHLKGRTAEDVLDALMSLYDTKSIDLVVIDSVTALAPKGELETKDGKQRSLEDDTIGLIARKLSQFFRMACGRNALSGCATIMVSQVRTDIGSYGGGLTITGGNALQHYNSLTLTIRRGAKADAPKAGETILGFNMVIGIEKTKLNNKEGQKLDVPFLHGSGISEKLLSINRGIALGIINRAGAWYEYEGTKFQGLTGLTDEITNEQLKSLNKAIKEAMKNER